MAVGWATWAAGPAAADAISERVLTEVEMVALPLGVGQ